MMMMLLKKKKARRGGIRPALERLERRVVLDGGQAGTLLVQLSQGASAGALETLVKENGASSQTTSVPGLIEVTGSEESLEGVSGAVGKTEGVAFAEPQQTVHVSTTPNDPLYTNGNSWGLNGPNGINAPGAWSVTTGSPATVTIASIDSGIDYNNPDLYQNIWINQPEIPASRMKNLVDVYHDGYISWRDLNNPINQGPGKITDVTGEGFIGPADILAPMILNANGTDSGMGGWGNPNNVQDGDTAHPDDLIGWNFVNNTNDPLDDYGHGTETAGVMAAMGNNGVGGVGVDWSAQVMVLEVIDSNGNATDTNVAEAVQYAAMHGARVANASFGAYGSSEVLNDAIASAGNAGMVFVAAAGNDGVDTDTQPFFPAAFELPNEIAVAATDQNGNLASFSNYGDQSVQIAAPGTDIETTVGASGYALESGTSVATPFVTGTIALLAGLHPSWTAPMLVQQVLATVTPDPSLAGKVSSGGIVDAAAAVGTVEIPLPPTVSWPTPADITYGTALSSTQLDASASVPGTWTYSPPAGTVLNAGAGQTLQATFVPNDTTHYTTVTESTTINVHQAVPIITWPTPADIAYGVALSSTQLDASATIAGVAIPGTFAYSPTFGTVLRAGAGQTLSVVFTPNDATDYASASASVSINVHKANPLLTWGNPADITYGTALGSNQLDATATNLGNTVAGTFNYTPAAGTVLHAGAAQLLSASFTPSDLADYNAGSVTATINVQQALPILIWPPPGAITYGTPLGPNQLDAAASVPGKFNYNPGLGTVLGAGQNTLLAAFVPTDTADYVGAIVSVPLTIDKAPLTVTAASQTRSRDAANLPLTYTLAGFVNGDSASSVIGAPALATSASSASLAGVYPITAAPGSLSALNYSFAHFVAGTLTVTGSGAAQTNDFDGDGKSNLAVIRPSSDLWLIRSASGSVTTTQFGDPTKNDIPVAADYQGIGKADLAVFRPSTDQWIIKLANGTTRICQFGDPTKNDIPVPGDYESDGQTDLAVFRPSTDQWLIQLANGSVSIQQFGDPTKGDIPVPGDYEGNGKLDLAVFRPSTDQWIIRLSNGSTRIVQFGDPTKGDIPVPGDYDGDGTTDLAVFRPSTDQWIIAYSSGGSAIIQFGDMKAGDIAALPTIAPQIKIGSSTTRSLALAVAMPPPPVIYAAPVSSAAPSTARKSTALWLSALDSILSPEDN